MLEFNRQILIRVGALLVRQHNIQPHRRAGAGKCAFIGRLHNAGAAAGNHRKARVRQFARKPLGKKIIGMIHRRAGAAVNAHRRLDGAQLFARFHKFGNDFQHMIRLARVHFAAHIFRQARVGQLFAQAHGRAFCWIGSAFIL